MSIALLLGICMAGFVYYDSGKRDVSMGARAGWTIVTFLLGAIGLIGYFIFGRKAKREKPMLLNDSVIDVTAEAKAEGVCVSCGKAIPVDAAYCGHCGKRQQEIIETSVKDAGSVICSSCGKALPIDATYCEHCGKKI